jgi:hypothetical protein
MSIKNGTTLTHEALSYLVGLIRDINGLDTKLIDDLNIKSNGTFSSVRITTLLNTLKTDCNDYTDSLVSNLSRLELKIVTDESSIVDSNILYLYKPTGQTSYNQYVVIEGNKVLLGTTDINMTDYYTITQADSKFALKTDFDALKTEVDKVKTTLGADSLNTTSQTVTGAINELNDKSTMVTLTQAEYNQLVTDGTIDNDTYYIISDDSENIDLNKFNIKTYTSVEQLGLTAPVTVGEIFNALPTQSIFIYGTAIARVTDLPTSDGLGILMIEKDVVSKFSITFKPSGSGALKENDLYIGQLKGADGTGLTWSRVCTTSVADVLLTKIDLSTKSSKLNGILYYCIKNGVCTVDLDNLSFNATGMNFVEINGILPAPMLPVRASLVNHSDNSMVGHCYMSTNNTKLGFHALKASSPGYITFSYPVAES